MREIGGYLEFEHYHGSMFHDSATKLNSGRNCLAYLLKSKYIKKIAIPYFLCDCIEDVCKKYGIKIRYYSINTSFHPIDVKPLKDEWLYLVNYYGQLSEEKIIFYKQEYDNRIILDNAHAYFEKPINGVNTLYTCRKYFGVSDGGILYTDSKISVDKQDESYDRVRFLVGRYERTANEFFKDSNENENHFYSETIKKMSRITENLLHSFDYSLIKKKRIANFCKLHSELKDINLLNLYNPTATFMYPLMIEGGEEIRKKLIAEKIYVPCLWPNVLGVVGKKSNEYYLTKDVLPLPIDQRYGISEMDYLIVRIKNALK